MSDEINSGVDSSSTPPPEDRVKNLQSEFNRKTGNLESKLELINQQLQQLSMLNQSSSQSPQKSEEQADPILEPARYREQLKNEMRREVESTLATQSRQQAELGSLVSAYPELNDADSDLTKESLRIYNSMSAHDRQHPSGYKMAIQSAALELGLLPTKKRQKSVQNQNESDDIGAATNGRSQSQPSKKSQKLDPATIAFAQALGKDVSSPDYIKRLEKAANRSGWSKYKNPTEY